LLIILKNPHSEKPCHAFVTAKKTAVFAILCHLFLLALRAWEILFFWSVMQPARYLQLAKANKGAEPMRRKKARVLRKLQKFRYFTVTERLYSAELGGYRSYGLVVRSADGWRLAGRISDVSPDAAFVSRAAALFNRLQLSPLHLKEAAEDIIAGL
jgi:hypothetical protein